MSATVAQPQALPELRAKFFNSAVESVLVCAVVAALFWIIDFGTWSSPSVPELLVTVTLPAFIFRDCIKYLLAKRRLGLIC